MPRRMLLGIEPASIIGGDRRALTTSIAKPTSCGDVAGLLHSEYLCAAGKDGGARREVGTFPGLPAGGAKTGAVAVGGGRTDSAAVLHHGTWSSIWLDSISQAEVDGTAPS
jgi:hypothetical protein